MRRRESRFIDYHEPATGLTTPFIKRNNRYYDPRLKLDGTSSPVEGDNYLMFFSGDPSYVGASTTFKPGVGSVASAANLVFRIFPTNSFLALTGTPASDTSMPTSIGRGWRMNTPLTGRFSASTYLVQLVLYAACIAGGAAGTSIAILPGVRIWFGSTASVIDGNYTSAFSTNTPQYGPSTNFGPGATQSVTLNFSISLGSAGGAGTVFILSGQYIFEEWFVKVTTPTGGKMQVQLGLNG